MGGSRCGFVAALGGFVPFRAGGGGAWVAGPLSWRWRAGVAGLGRAWWGGGGNWVGGVVWPIFGPVLGCGLGRSFFHDVIFSQREFFAA